jgi:predicted membrane protein (TIGR00267 family)
MRRYFVVNGFDGALTMLGLSMGFYVSNEASIGVMLTACLGAAVALFMSGVTSAFLSEWEERKRSLAELERAMVADLSESVHAEAARAVPFVIALVNGLAPLSISVVIITPLILARAGIDLPLSGLEATIALAFIVIFLLGVFLGHVGGGFWLWSGLRTVLIAVATALIAVATALIVMVVGGI